MFHAAEGVECSGILDTELVMEQSTSKVTTCHKPLKASVRPIDKVKGLEWNGGPFAACRIGSR
jgi:hypothetical protein